MRSKVMLVAAGLLLKAASAQAQAFTENFDNITTLPASGWVQTNNSQPIGVTGWFQGNSAVFPAQAGAPTAYIGANFNNGGGLATISNWLLTPPVTLVNGATINFWTRKIASAFPDRLQVRMSTAGNGSDVGTTATSVGTFTTLLLDINPTYQPDPAYPIVWTQFNVTVTGVASPTLGRLAFRYFVENGGPSGANSDYIGIDTVVFTPGVVNATVAPAGLTVDAAGNGVLQPNEAAVVVAPRWTNTSTVAIANLTGTLSAFTGPAGPTYTITDGAADYGTVAPGATQACTDCYAVSATAATRPATHWDASAVETITPDTQGQQKTWPLHVGDSFTDVPPPTRFYRFIETLLHHGVTGGCTATDVLPGQLDHARADGGVRARGEGGRRLRARRPAARRRCSPTCPRPAPSAAGSRSWPGAAWSAAAAAATTARPIPVTREQMAVFVLRTLDPALNPPACAPPTCSTTCPRPARSAAGSRS